MEQSRERWIRFFFAPAGIFFHIVQYIPYIIGFPLQVTQKISLVFWFGLIAFSAYIYSDNLVKNNRLLKILFVCLYSLNIYMFNSWENVKVSNLSLVRCNPATFAYFYKIKRWIIKLYESRTIFSICKFGFVRCRN